MSTPALDSPVEETPTTPEEPRRRLSLRDAVRICGMSEKTLRRKLEAGILRGHRENLDYGGFMWLIEARSLAELYPSPALDEYLVNGPEPEIGEDEEASAPSPSPAALDKEADPRFVSYLMEQARELREELKQRDERMQELQARALVLEREVGEQRGTAITQARVLEWFQKQPTPMLAPPPAPPGQASDPPVRPLVRVRPELWAMLGTLVGTGLLLELVRRLA